MIRSHPRPAGLPALVLAVAPALVLTTAVAPPAPLADVLPMTRDRLEEAESAGRRAAGTDDLMREGTCRTKARPDVLVFDVTITTPFAAVACAAFLAMRRGEPIDLSRWTFEPPERQSVIVSADPAALSVDGQPPPSPASVKKVVLRRGAQIIEARRADFHEVRFPGLDGGDARPRIRRGGAFYFPLDPFAPAAGDLEIVVIPETGQEGAVAVLTLKQEDLAALR